VEGSRGRADRLVPWPIATLRVNSQFFFPVAAELRTKLPGFAFGAQAVIGDVCPWFLAVLLSGTFGTIPLLK
jgi:hypothetical protein